MQRDDWYSAARAPAGLADAEALGRYAGERALARLGARRLSTRRAPVLFEAPLAALLLGSFVSAASGGNLYRKSSFLARQPRPGGVRARRHDRGAPARAARARQQRRSTTRASPRRRATVVHDGVLEGYFLGSYSARKLGLRSTGNAGGSHNLVLVPDGPDFRGMLRRLDRGLLVTELLGHGVNLITGDYSRGAAGFWVEGGEIAYPVEEITVAGNLKDMFRGIAASGSDMVVRGSRRCGSVLVEGMTIAGE